MIYNDGVQTDEELRVKFCPRCENEVLSTHAEYCKICGLRLYNYCTGKITEDPYHNSPLESEKHLNKSDARYCESCGESTLYGQENLLKTWEDLKKKREETKEFEPIDTDNLPF